MQARRLEVWAYVHCDQWKRTYRHTLVNDFRKHITDAKNEIIRAFELPNKMRSEKAYHYNAALVELALVESCMDVMVADEIGVMSGKEWADVAERVDDMRIGLSRLVSSLYKGGSESPNCGTGSASEAPSSAWCWNLRGTTTRSPSGEDIPKPTTINANIKN